MNLSGSSSRAGQVHQDWAGTFRLARGAAHVSDHGFPFGFAVMRTVNPNAAGAPLQEVPYPAIILCRLRGQGYHDADMAVRRWFSKQMRGVVLNGAPAANEVLQ